MADGSPIVSYAHFARGLHQIQTESLADRRDVAASLLARFFDFNQVAGQTGTLSGINEQVQAYSLYELALPHDSKPTELRRSSYPEAAAAVSWPWPTARRS